MDRIVGPRASDGSPPFIGHARLSNDTQTPIECKSLWGNADGVSWEGQVDSNEQTGGGRGSGRFAILVRGEESYQSGVMREDMAAVPISVE